MRKTFSVDDFIARIGERLVWEFQAAREATTPVAVGDAIEEPVRDQLEQILPRGIGVGSGFVIDSSGATSRQTDVILYEKEICPIFSVNKARGTVYYPCEGVIAVGQVKSTLNKSLLKEEFEKIASVKRLRRYPVHGFRPHPTTGAPVTLERSYGGMRTPSIVDIGERSETDESRQIFGFIIAGSAQTRTETLTDAFLEFTRETSEQLSPNLAAVLTEGVWNWGNVSRRRAERIGPKATGTYGMRVSHDGPPKWENAWSAQNAEVLLFKAESEPFRTLIQWIYELYWEGKTSDVRAFNRYFVRSESAESIQREYRPKNGMTFEEFVRRKNL